MAESRLALVVVTALSLLVLGWRGTVSADPPHAVVEVVGAVAQPTFVRIEPGDVAADAIAAAGGPQSRAAEPLSDGDRVRVWASGHAHVERADPLLFGERVDLNRDDRQALMALDGVGPSTAARVAEAAPFARPAELERVRGLGTRAVASLEPLVQTPDAPVRPPPARIDINSASAAQLEALPGIGPALAGRIVASREAEGPFASVSALQRVRGIGPRTVERLADRAEVP